MEADVAPDEALLLTTFAKGLREDWERLEAARRERYPSSIEGAGFPFLVGDDQGSELIDSAVRLIVCAAEMTQASAGQVRIDEIGTAAEEGRAHLLNLNLALDNLGRAADRLTGWQVRRLRQLQVSWRQIGSALGVTGQSAHHKYRDGGKES